MCINTLDFFDLALPNFFIFIFLIHFYFWRVFFLFWKISKVAPKHIEQRRIYAYIQSQPRPTYYSTNKKNFLQSKFIISFSQLVISHELSAIYFNISFFGLHRWEINGILFISFMSVSKFIMVRRCFPLNYTYRA